MDETPAGAFIFLIEQTSDRQLLSLALIDSSVTGLQMDVDLHKTATEDLQRSTEIKKLKLKSDIYYNTPHKAYTSFSHLLSPQLSLLLFCSLRFYEERVCWCSA